MIQQKLGDPPVATEVSSQLRHQADARSRRIAAHERIEQARERMGNIDSLLGLRNVPEHQIRISRAALEEILHSSPGDDD
jgi:hypothetical protein